MTIREIFVLFYPAVVGLIIGLIACATVGSVAVVRGEWCTAALLFVTCYVAAVCTSKDDAVRYHEMNAKEQGRFHFIVFGSFPSFLFLALGAAALPEPDGTGCIEISGAVAIIGAVWLTYLAVAAAASQGYSMESSED